MTEQQKQATEHWLEHFNKEQKELTKVERALAVLVCSRETIHYLIDNDPMALTYGQEALCGKSYRNFM